MMALLARIVRPKRRLDGLTFTVYTRVQCCCCHKAIDMLRDYRKRFGFAIEEVDVDSDQALVDAYGLTVPVVALNGKVRFKGVINPALLERLLTAESGST